MQWRGRQQSGNVIDRRGGGGLAIGGGIGSIVIALLVYLLGGDPSNLPQSPQSPTQQSPGGVRQNPGDDTLKEFVGVVLKETEDVWTKLFNEQGSQYTKPHLVLFSDRVNSACGMAGAAMGPFYCPNDEQVYIDLSFYRMLKSRLGAPGDFAQAYVIAHEVGHHVQKLLGISEKVQSAMQRGSKTRANDLSVRLELQADYFAGVWAHYAQEKGILDAGDIDEALNAAAAVGDDKLQRETQGEVVPDSFTHGTSEQRARWFRKGFQTGDIQQGDTFNAGSL